MREKEPLNLGQVIDRYKLGVGVYLKGHLIDDDFEFLGRVKLDIDALVAEVEKLRDLVDHLKNWCASPEDEAAAKAEEREQCCLNVCDWCRKERPFLPNTILWHVPFGEGSGPLECRAYPIRRRAANQEK